MVDTFGGRGAWLATPIIQMLVLVGAVCYIYFHRSDDPYSAKRLLLPSEHGEIPTDDQEEGGYGIFLVKKKFSSVVYRHEEMFDSMANHLIMELPLS